MPYIDSIEYVKLNQSCDCESAESCTCDTSCGCCPLGTVEVKDADGCTVGCMTPSDAAQYYLDTIDVPEGYIKTFDSEGVYIGLLTVDQYADYQNNLNPNTNTFNIFEPVGATGSPDIVSVAGGTASDPTLLSSFALKADRIAVSEDITIEIISGDSVTFTGGVTTITMPSTQSTLVTSLVHSVGLPGPSTSFTLRWTSGVLVKTQVITLALA